MKTNVNRAYLACFGVALASAIYGGILFAADCVYGTAPNAAATCMGANGGNSCPEGCRRGFDRTDYEGVTINRESTGTDYRPTMATVPCKTLSVCEVDVAKIGRFCINNECTYTGDPDDDCRNNKESLFPSMETTYNDNPGCVEE